jgi:hypothetical protein
VAGEWWLEPLGELRWHWGSAYIINRLGLDRWLAMRRDTGAALAAATPTELHDLIVEDYIAQPVPRAARR